MQILWKLERAFLKEVVQEFPAPRLPSTTIASIIRKLEQKNYIDHKTFNNSHQYFPVLKEEAYKRGEVKSIVNSYFNDSFSEMVSFFMQKGDTNIDELEEIVRQIKAKKK